MRWIRTRLVPFAATGACIALLAGCGGQPGGPPLPDGAVSMPPAPEPRAFTDPIPQPVAPLETELIINGGFEEHSGHRPIGWRFVDQPGQITFIDQEVKCEGSCSLRMQDIGRHNPQHGHGRACQTIEVEPFRYYHVSVAVKTQEFEAARDVRIAVLAEGGATLNHIEPRIEKTQG